MNRGIKLVITSVVLVAAIGIGMTASAMYGETGANEAGAGAPTRHIEPTPTMTVLATTCRGAGCGYQPTAEPELTCEQADACTCGPGDKQDCPLATPSCDDGTLSCGFTPPAPGCQPEMSIEDCYPNARPAGPYACSIIEIWPPIVRCLPPYCEPPSPPNPVEPASPLGPPTSLLAPLPAPGVCMPDPCGISENCAPPPCIPLPEPRCPTILPDCAIQSDGPIPCTACGSAGSAPDVAPNRTTSTYPIVPCPPICADATEPAPSLRATCPPIVCPAPRAAPTTPQCAPPLCAPPPDGIQCEYRGITPTSSGIVAPAAMPGARP